ncbi:MAG: FecR domain-containing protein [Myxococcota bacterium]|nr:FecR domain-containing protein [Myxococcota bacterium]
MKTDDDVLHRLGEQVRAELGAAPERAFRHEGAVVARRKPRRWVALSAVGLAAACLAVFALVPRLTPARTFWVGDVSRPGVVGAWVDAPAQASLPIVFNDGSRFELGADTGVQVRKASRSRVELSLRRGSVRASVKSAQACVWSVEAGPYLVTVTGTIFTTDWDAKERILEVTVSSGQVRVTGHGLDEAGVTLTGGQRLRIGDHGPMPVESPPAEPTVPSDAGASDAGEPKLNDGAPQPAKHAGRKAAMRSERWLALADDGKFADAHAAAVSAGAYAADELARQKPDALLVLANLARGQRDADHATRALETLRQRHPGSSAAHLAAFLLGRIAMDLKDDPSLAAVWFERYLKENAQGSVAEEALGRLMDVYERSGQTDAARRTARDYSERYPDGLFLERARGLLR